MAPRRKSVDSSDSSDSSSSSDLSHKKTKKDKHQKHQKSHKSKTRDNNHVVAHTASNPSLFPAAPTSNSLSHNMSGFPEHPQERFQGGNFPSPPQYQAPPPSGFRVPLTTDVPFPEGSQDIGNPPFFDADGSPVFIGSALMENSVHPCKIGPHLRPFASVPYGGGEHGHNGRYDLLPFRPHEMEFVPTSYGRIPEGRRPVEGGYEDNGAKLYHAVGNINGIRVPGKAGEHLGGCRVAFGGVEHEISEGYEILCWR